MEGEVVVPYRCPVLRKITLASILTIAYNETMAIMRDIICMGGKR